MKKMRIVFIVLMLLLSITACAKNDGALSVDENSDIITITGLQDEDIEINVEEIKKMQAVTKDAILVDSNGEETPYNAKGTLFESILGKYNKSQKELAGIRLVASDGYSIVIPGEILNNRDIILAYEMDGKPLDEESEPLRIVIPDERGMYWVKKLSKIESIKSLEKDEINKLVMLDTASQIINQYDYTYYENVDKAIRANELLDKFTSSESFERVYIKASDGLEKNETAEVFNDADIKITGKEAPLFTSPDMPEGMHVKDMLWFGCGQTGFLTVDEALQVFDPKSYGDKEGVNLKDVFNEVGMALSDKYAFTADDGYSVEISADDIDKGIIYKKEDVVQVCFEGLEKNTEVKKLLSIEAIK